MLEIVLGILISYLLCITIFTLVVRNDAMHKNAPDVKLWPIIIDGAKGFAIGFVIIAGIYFLWSFVNYLLV